MTRNNQLFTLLFMLVVCSLSAQSGKFQFEEKDGLVSVEAEHFASQEMTDIRQWHLTSTERSPRATSDGDDPHTSGASGNAYLEILPDTRRNHEEKLIHGENFSNQPGKLGILSYRIYFNDPGKYYVWVRAYSSGSEDNGIHVGLNGEWPDSGQRMQWCEGKNTWTWASKQRTREVHCGVDKLIYLNIPKVGWHTVTFSMREDGFEFDKFVLSRDYVAPLGTGPSETIYGEAPKAAAAQTPLAKGTVYLDANSNGQRDPGEQTIEGVKVSNGVEVVKTDPEGQYAIALPPESTLFISKPAGYSLPLNDVQLPQFYYHHYPDGTPDAADWKWPVIQPTGPLPETIDFPLLEGVVPDTFKAMGFADPQTARDEELDMMRKDIIDALFGNPHQAEFGLVAGDVVNDNLALYERHNKLMAQIGIPIWNVPGNHDLNQESPNHEYATQTFKSVFGPDYYAFDYGQVHFLALNNVGFKGKGNGYEGHIDAKQMQWIENDLQDVPTDHLIIIITHIPLITYANNRTFPNSINTTNFKDLLRILARFQHIYTIAGHDTSNSWKVEVDHKHGWYGAPFIAHTLAETRGGGWQRGPKDERGVRPATMQDGNPNGYYVFYFDGNQVRPRFIPAGGDPTDRLRITLDPQLVHPDSVAQTYPLGLDRGALQDSTFVVVNFFDGGERDQVTVSLDGDEPVPMAHIERTDPFYVRQYQKYEGTDDAFASPQVSSHIWQWPLPRLKPGVHSIVVTAKDEFGFEDREVLTFEVME